MSRVTLCETIALSYKMATW